MNQRITSDQVRAEIQRFWNAFSAKSADLLMDMYSPEATVFSSTASRPEPGRLAAARRKREYFNAQTSIRVTLGPMDVVVLGDSSAVAAYTFQFHASRVTAASGGQREEDIQHGRASQVLRMEDDGRLRIVHEHFSAVE